MKKVTKSKKLNAAIVELLQKAHSRAIWLSNTLRDLSNRFDSFRDETRLKVGSLWEAIDSQHKDVEQLRLASGDLFNRTATGFDRVQKDVTGLRADVNRAWTLQESRNSVFRKFEDDVLRTLQTFNEHISKLEGDTYFIKIAQVDNAGVINSHSDRLKIVEGQTGMLGECAGNNNSRLQTLEEKIQEPCDLANATWHHMVGIEKRVTRVEEHEDWPSTVDQYIVDSKLTGVYSRIAALEKRIREASEPTQAVTVNESGFHLDRKDPRVNPSETGQQAKPMAINKEAFLRP